ncbi:MAG: PAS domain S-box-containing protein, partial [Candidatus Latescibacterota bacterium]
PFSHGTLAVNSTEANAFSDADISALRSLAEVLSEGFHRLQDLKEIVRHRHQLASEVAERQQSESSLRHSQVHFDNIIDNLAAGILVTDLADTILFSNERMAKMVGHTIEEMIDRTAYKLFLDPEDWSVLEEQNRQRARGTAWQYEIKMRHKDGRYFWAEITAGPYRDYDGTIIGTVGTLTDISDRKRTAAELQRRESLIQGFQNIGHTALSTLDLDRILEDLAEQIIKAGFFRSLMIAIVDHEERRVQIMRSFVNRRDEEAGWLPGTIDPSQGDKVQGISYDLDHDDNITAQVARQGELKVLVEWNEKYDARIDDKTSADGKVAYFIPVKKGDDVLAVLATGSDIEEKEQTLQNIEIMQPLLEQAAVALDHARLYGQLQRAKDEAEKLQAEAERSQAEAEEANRAKSQFLANMSHEIRTPMNAVIGMTELMMDTELGDTQREYLGIVKSSAHSLLQVIGDILDFSKVESGKLAIEYTAFSLREAVADAIKTVMPRVQGGDIALNHHIDGEIPAFVVGDPLRLRQVLINLLDNAVKFTAMGEVELRAAVEGVEADALILHFSVRDTGTGIELEKQQRIFEAFTQADSSTTRRYGGTGLGLAICHQLVQLMGGNIWVDSEMGSGSTFHFTARFVAGAQESLATAPARELVRPLRLLLAEDNAFNQRLAVVLLEKQKHSVTVVSGGAQAVEISAQQSFDVVLMDVQMPEMDGLAATRAIRSREAENSTARLPIIGLTAHAMQGDRERCIEAGMDDYVAKPIDPEVLYATLAATAADPGRTSPTVSSNSSTKGDLDLSAALERCAGDEQLLIDLIAIFREDWPDYVQRMDSDIAAGDAAALSRSAHAIKSPLASIGLDIALAYAVKLEQISEELQFIEAAEICDMLRRELERVNPLLAAWQGKRQ